jgi:hypothetical protein
MKSSDKTYDEIQKALALKRHEKPPPRFFRGFSSEVIDRLNTPEPPRPLTWRERLGLGEDPKPVLLCALGILLCVALGTGLIAALKVDPPKQTDPQVGDPVSTGLPPLPAPSDQGLPGFTPMVSQGSVAGSTAPVMTPSANGPALDPLESIPKTPPSKPEK